MRKKPLSFPNNPALIIGAITLLGLIGTCVVKLAAYIVLPQRVEAVEEKTKEVSEYIKEQQMANNLMQKMITDEHKAKDSGEPVIAEDGKHFYNPSTKNWEPIKHLKAYMENSK